MVTKRIAFSLLAVLTVPAAAAPAEGLASAIEQCSAQPDDKARLGCYDRIASQLKSGAVSAPVTQAAPSAPSAAPAPQVGQAAPQQGGAWYNPADWFGKNNARQTSSNPADFGSENIPAKPPLAGQPVAPEAIDQITAKVTAVTMTPSGRFKITLDNGQIWKQSEGDTSPARFKKTGDSVTISRGALGSYNLVLEGHKQLYKVNRVQ